MPELDGINHVALTVSDLAVSRPWYEKLFGAAVLWEEENPPGHMMLVLLVPPFALGLHTHDTTESGDRFVESRVGLDHMAFGVPDLAALEEWVKHLDDLGIEHSGVKEAPYGTVVTFRDPDNIQLEFFALPG